PSACLRVRAAILNDKCIVAVGELDALRRPVTPLRGHALGPTLGGKIKMGIAGDHLNFTWHGFLLFNRIVPNTDCQKLTTKITKDTKGAKIFTLTLVHFADLVVKSILS